MGICVSKTAQKVCITPHQRFIEVAVERKTESATTEPLKIPERKQSAAEIARKAAIARHNARVAAHRSAKNGDDDSN
jgi:hypothetical protein